LATPEDIMTPPTPDNRTTADTTHVTRPARAREQDGKIFVLVHGGAHGAWAFEKLAWLLVQNGSQVIARDLPGHGLRARFPKSYLERPVDLERLAVEPSPVAKLCLQDYTDEVIADITGLAAQLPERRIILVGHSMAGLILNYVGEAIPQLISRLAYLSAWMIADGRSFNDYLSVPEFSTTTIPSILVADPMVTGALRMDFRSDEPTYQARAKDAFAADIDDDAWTAVAHLLTPDTPAGPMAEPVTITPDRWGQIPRTYISCTADQAVPVPAQRRFIGEADKFTPHNLTEVREIATSHSPFVSQPEELARILLQL
jgi:pimeloyl-ACP methyl ester carboxylesterase